MSFCTDHGLKLNFELHLFLFRMNLHSAGIQIGHRLYNVLLSQEHLLDIRKRGMVSEVVQELLLNEDFTVMGPELPNS